MFKGLIQKYSLVLVVGVMLLGFALRYHNHTQWPREGATFDEYAWTWLGINLIQKGVPISWSPHPQYTIRTHYIQNGARFWLVQPYLEHPPLFGLVSGGYALARGVPDMYHVRFSVMRELALIMGVVSILLVYLLGSTLYGKPAGLLSSFLYALMPTVVVGSRILQNENFFIPVFLAILYCLVQYIEKRKSYYFVIVSILSGLITLAKVPWFAAPAAVTLILLHLKKKKPLIAYWGVVLSIFSTFLLYGYLWDKDLFFSLWKLQLNRYDLTFDSMFALFNQPFLVDRYYTDGWIYMGWAAFALMLSEQIKNHRYVLFGMLAYFFIFVFAIPNEPGHGWYRYPFYPFLAIALSWAIRNYFNKNYLLTALFLLCVGLSLLQHTWFDAFGFSYLVFRTYIMLCVLGALPLWFSTKKIIRVSTFIHYLLFCVIVLLSVWAALSYNEQ